MKNSFSKYKLIYSLVPIFIILAAISFYQYFVVQDINHVIESCLAVVSATNFTYVDVVFFSHVCIAAVSLSLGFFVLFKKRTLESIILFSIATSVTLWLALDQLTWSFGYNAAVTLFAWSLLSFVGTLFCILNLYFFCVFLFKKDVTSKTKYLFFALLLPAIILTPTKYNLSGWDMIECQAIESPYLTYYAYAIGILAAIWIAVIAIKQRKSMNREQRKILILLTIGSEFSLLLFNLSNIVGSWTLDWHISQYGLFGIPVFIGLLSYLIIKYRVFDVKLVAAQALVIALIILGVTQIIFVKDKSNLSLRSIAIGLFITLCVWLIYSIRTETRQKDELSQANQKLKRLDQAKDDFINIASHQLKSPIAILKNTLEVSNQDQVSKNESSKQISRLETLVSEILLASKLATEKYSAKNQDVINLQKLIQEIVDDQKALSQEKVDLVFRFPSQATPELRGDQLYLREAFANVIHNAVKYSKPDTKNTIELLLQYGSQDNPQEKTYTFTCKDSGIGISKEDLSKLFTKFSRGSNVYAKSGTGLGLYITKEIIEGHGGHIAIMSELGKGTEVTIALLAGKAEAN